MRVLDVFSMLPVKELGIEQIEDIFIKSFDGGENDTYAVVNEISDDVGNNIVECQKELVSGGKQVAYIMQKDMVVAVVGYKN